MNENAEPLAQKNSQDGKYSSFREWTPHEVLVRNGPYC